MWLVCKFWHVFCKKKNGYYLNIKENYKIKLPFMENKMEII